MAYLKSIVIILFSITLIFRIKPLTQKIFIEDKNGRQIYKIDDDWLYLENNTKEINDIHTLGQTMGKNKSPSHLEPV